MADPPVGVPFPFHYSQSKSTELFLDGLPILPFFVVSGSIEVTVKVAPKEDPVATAPTAVLFDGRPGVPGDVFDRAQLVFRGGRRQRCTTRIIPPPSFLFWLPPHILPSALSIPGAHAPWE